MVQKIREIKEKGQNFVKKWTQERDGPDSNDLPRLWWVDPAPGVYISAR